MSVLMLLSCKTQSTMQVFCRNWCVCVKDIVRVCVSPHMPGMIFKRLKDHVQAYTQFWYVLTVIPMLQHFCVQQEVYSRCKKRAQVRVAVIQLQQIAAGNIQIRSMVLNRYVLVSFGQLPFRLVSSIVPIGIQQVCETCALHIVILDFKGSSSSEFTHQTLASNSERAVVWTCCSWSNTQIKTVEKVEVSVSNRK